MVSKTAFLFTFLVAAMLAGCMNKSIPQEPEANGDLMDNFALKITDEDAAAVKELLTTEPLLLNEPHPGRENKTPLHFAAMTGNEEIVRFLLDQGADPYAVDDEGQYPNDLALQAGANQSVLDLLKIQ